MKIVLCSICYARNHCVISVKAMMLVRVQHMQILAGVGNSPREERINAKRLAERGRQ